MQTLEEVIAAIKIQAGKIEDLEKQLADQGKLITDLEKNQEGNFSKADIDKSIDKMRGMLTEQMSKLANQSTEITSDKKDELPTIPKEPLEFGGKKYKWQLAHFRIPGRDAIHKAEEANEDEAIIKEILAIKGQGILKELV